MKFFSIILIFLSFTTINAFAQNDSEAAQLLEKISDKYKKVDAYYIDVELTIDIPEVKENVNVLAKVWLKGDKYKIDFDEKIIQSNTISEWTYLKDVNELQIGNYDPSSMMFLPSKLFNLYSDEYIYRVKEEYKDKKGDLIKVLELTPTDKDFKYFKIITKINTRTMEIVESIMFEKTGYKYSYKILKIDTNIKLSENFFVFDVNKYKIETDDITDFR